MSDYLKVLPHYIIPKRALTTLAGWFANTKTPRVKNYLIESFIKRFHVNMSEAVHERPEDYASFNDFFIRHLKPGTRPLGHADLLSPVDGCVSEIGNIQVGQLLQAKNRFYSVHDLLACDSTLSHQFAEGRFATLYLSPKDYHRVHMPIAGTLTHMIHVPGQLFSVQPLTVRTISQVFACNERLVMFFNTKIGKMAMVMVGATIVGAIGTSWAGDLARPKKPKLMDYRQSEPISLQQGDEVGYFKLGSTVILLFAEREHMEWNTQVQPGSLIRLGNDLGRFQLG